MKTLDLEQMEALRGGDACGALTGAWGVVLGAGLSLSGATWGVSTAVAAGYFAVTYGICEMYGSAMNRELN